MQQAENRRVTLQRKAYEPGDLAGAFVVIAAINDLRLAEAIQAETQEHGQLLNIVDIPRYCSFIMPSVLRREQLTIAVSTEGASPGLAKRIRQSLEEIFPPAYGTYLRLASLARTHLRDNRVSYSKRDDFFGDFYTSDILGNLIEGNTTEAIALVAALLKDYGIDLPAGTLETEFSKEKKDVSSNAQT